VPSLPLVRILSVVLRRLRRSRSLSTGIRYRMECSLVSGLDSVLM
jgi:hypothetical protein